MILAQRYFEDSPVRLGKFRCPAYHPSFENTGPAKGYLVVFPRETVEITHAGESPVVANPNVLMFYNHNQEYRRRKISDWGDRCEFFDIDRELLIRSIRRYRPEVEEHFESPFHFVSRSASDRLYLAQRKLVETVAEMDANSDRLQWDELSIQLVNQIIDESFVAESKRNNEIKPSHQDLAFDAQYFISNHFRSNLTLEEIALAIDSSAFHLCRVFSKVTGVSIHQYVTRLRMRASLEMIRAGLDLTQVAFDLGYSSHSHFTSVFRRCYGLTPRQWRNERS